MTKLVLIVFLLGLQNPPPSSGKNSQPPQKEAKSEQNNSPITNAETNTPAVVADNNAPNSQQRADNTTTEETNKSTQHWWLEPEWVSICVAGAMVAVGISQFIMYWCQWNIMRSSFRQAGIASQKSIKHSRESSEKGLRAYIGTVNSTFYSENDTTEPVLELPNIYLLRIENTGQTPAHNVRCNSTWDYIEGIEAHWPEGAPFKNAIQIHEETPDARGSLDTLAGGHRMRYRCVLRDQKDGTTFEDALAQVFAKKRTIFIYGTINYQDVFKKNRYTNFCVFTVHFVEDKVHFSSYHKHNDCN